MIYLSFVIIKLELSPYLLLSVLGFFQIYSRIIMVVDIGNQYFNVALRSHLLFLT